MKKGEKGIGIQARFFDADVVHPPKDATEDTSRVEGVVLVERRPLHRREGLAEVRDERMLRLR